MEKCKARFSCLVCAFPAIQQSAEGALHHRMPSWLVSVAPGRRSPDQILWMFSGHAKARLQQSESVWWVFQFKLWFLRDQKDRYVLMVRGG